MVEKSDEFYEWMLNRQNFPYQNFVLKIFSIAYFTVISYKLEFSGFLLLCMSELVILKYFHPISDKKNPPEDRELYLICLAIGRY